MKRRIVGEVRTATIWSVMRCARCCCRTSRRSASLQRVDGGVRGAKLPLQLLGEEDCRSGSGRAGRAAVSGAARAGHLLGDRGGESEEADRRGSSLRE